MKESVLFLFFLVAMAAAPKLAAQQERQESCTGR